MARLKDKEGDERERDVGQIAQRVKRKQIRIISEAGEIKTRVRSMREGGLRAEGDERQDEESRVGGSVPYLGIF